MALQARGGKVGLRSAPLSADKSQSFSPSATLALSILSIQTCEQVTDFAEKVPYCSVCLCTLQRKTTHAF